MSLSPDRCEQGFGSGQQSAPLEAIGGRSIGEREHFGRRTQSAARCEEAGGRQKAVEVVGDLTRSEAIIGHGVCPSSTLDGSMPSQRPPPGQGPPTPVAGA